MTSGVLGIAIAIALASVGAWVLRAVKRARETGIAQFPLEWPSGFSRDEHPGKFGAAVVRNTIFGAGMIALAGAVAVFALVEVLI